MKMFKMTFISLCMVVVLIFIIQNTQELAKGITLKLDLFIVDVGSGSIPLYSLIFLCFFTGILLTGSYSMYGRYRLKSHNKTLQRSLVERERELNSLRNLPVIQSEAPLQAEEGSPFPKG